MYLRRLAVPDCILLRVIAEYCALAFALCAAWRSIAELLLKPFLPESAIIQNYVMPWDEKYPLFWNFENKIAGLEGITEF